MDAKKRKKGGVPERVSEQRREVVERIERDMAGLGLEWVRPWGYVAAPHNPATGTVYRGRNRFLLAVVGAMRGFDDPRWVTFNQARKSGWSVKKGAQAAAVEKWKAFRLERGDGDVADGEVEDELDEVRYACVGYWNVFNACEVEGMPPLERNDRRWSDEALDGIADLLEASSRCPVRELPGRGALYSPGEDFVQVPPRGSFCSGEAFVATLLHEMAHSTGHPDALGRRLASTRSDPEGYAREELVAELSSVFSCADLGIGRELDPGSEHYRNHLAYLESWKRAIRDDPDALFKAASAAERATGYLMDRYRDAEAPA